MDTLSDTEETTIDLNNYSTEDACYWLLNKLQVTNFISEPYTTPFCSYVLTWHEAVPITSIIMGQSPYPNNIFPPIAAAMSYDPDLCLGTKVKKDIPPTVEVLANDLYINAGFKKEYTIELIKNGWTLVSKGVLLVNQCIFYTQNKAEGMKESVDQCKVLIRLLRETEKFGKRTVDIYGMGQSGQKMASDLCSWFKSTTVKLSKHTAPHPAGVARRFTNLSHSQCHLGTPSFSKSLTKCLSNHVALLYTMPPKNRELDAKLQRQADILKALSGVYYGLEEKRKKFINLLKELMDTDTNNVDEFKKVVERLIGSGEELVMREGMAASLTSNVQGITQTMSSQVSKAAPSLGAVNPSTTSPGTTESRYGMPTPSVASVASEVVFRDRRGPKAPESATLQQDTKVEQNIKLPESTTSEVVFRNRKESNISAISTPSKSTTQSPNLQPITTTTTTSATFRNQNLTPTFKQLSSSGQKENIANSLTKDQSNQLSSVGAIVELNKEDADQDTKCQAYLEDIQTDIVKKAATSEIVKALLPCIDNDIRNIADFNLANWVGVMDITCETFEKCKEYFNF